MKVVRHAVPKHEASQEELPSLSRVFGYIAIKEMERLEDRVKLLARLGYPNREIAIICGTTPETVATLKAKKPLLLRVSR